MRRKLMIALAALVMMTASFAHAEDVFVTKKGKRYHKAESRFIKGKEVTKLTREEAEAKGYKPSSEFEVEVNNSQNSNKK